MQYYTIDFDTLAHNVNRVIDIISERKQYNKKKVIIKIESRYLLRCFNEIVNKAESGEFSDIIQLGSLICDTILKNDIFTVTNRPKENIKELIAFFVAYYRIKHELKPLSIKKEHLNKIIEILKKEVTTRQIQTLFKFLFEDDINNLNLFLQNPIDFIGYDSN